MMKIIGKRFTVLKTLIVAALLFSAGYIAFRVPAAAESFYPFSGAIKPELCVYCPSVSAKGSIVKNGEEWFAVVAVNEGDISSVETGQSAILSGAAFPDGSFSGTVEQIGDSAHAAALSAVSTPETVVDVTVKITQGDTKKLRAGYSVTAEIRTGDERTVTMLPYSVIDQDETGEFVYVLEKGSAVKRGIVTGIELSDRTEIVSGLDGKDSVLTNPEALFDGARVRMGKAE